MFFDTTDLKNQEIYLHLYKTADENIEKGYVPAYYFKIVRCDDNTEVGQCDLRVGHNDNTKYGGNIGYEIYKSFRGNHYASKACKLLFLLAKKHKMEEVIITCSPENIASRKTCEYCGAELVDIIDVPTWHELYKSGQKETCQYIVRLDETMILHCMKKQTWEEIRNREYFGESDIKLVGFIHCSPVKYMWRVAPNFKDITDELVLLCINTHKLESEIRWEDGDNCGRSYPRVYGLINLDAVTAVLPYLKDENGNWIKNDELKNIPNK